MARLISSTMGMRRDFTGWVMVITECGPERPQMSSVYMGECSERSFRPESRNQWPSSAICALSRWSRCCLTQKISTSGIPACWIFVNKLVVRRWFAHRCVDSAWFIW